MPPPSAQTYVPLSACLFCSFPSCNRPYLTACPTVQGRPATCQRPRARRRGGGSAPRPRAPRSPPPPPPSRPRTSRTAVASAAAPPPRPAPPPDMAQWLRAPLAGPRGIGRAEGEGWGRKRNGIVTRNGRRRGRERSEQGEETITRISRVSHATARRFSLHRHSCRQQLAALTVGFTAVISAASRATDRAPPPHSARPHSETRLSACHTQPPRSARD
ncbi:unnamed protein product [Closterium sp. NIES-54]